MSDQADTPCLAPDSDYYKQWGHHEIGVRIRICKQFIVHIDKDGKLDWENCDAHEAEFYTLPEETRKKLNSALSDIVVCEANSLVGYAEDHKVHFLTVLGEAYVHWLERDADAAVRLVKFATKYHRERSEEMSRNWYLTTSMVIAGFCLFFGVIVWFSKAVFIEHAGTTAFHAALSASFGAVGALLSVIARSGKLKFRASSGQDLHFLEATSRICAGAISGVIAYLALKSGLILGTFATNPHRGELFLLASLAAGSGERLATSIISKFDDSSANQTDATKTSSKHGVEE